MVGKERIKGYGLLTKTKCSKSEDERVGENSKDESEDGSEPRYRNWNIRRLGSLSGIAEMAFNSSIPVRGLSNKQGQHQNLNGAMTVAWTTCLTTRSI